MDLREVRGSYGSHQTPCTVLVYGDWYCVAGSVNINRTSQPELLVDGVWVEELPDYDTMTARDPVEDLTTLAMEVDECPTPHAHPLNTPR